MRTSPGTNNRSMQTERITVVCPELEITYNGSKHAFTYKTQSKKQGSDT